MPAQKSKTITASPRIFITIVVALVAIRIALPYIVLYYANKSLASMKGYCGHINDVDIALYRGAYQVKDFYIDKKDSLSGKRYPFMAASLIDLSVEWHALFQGRIVGELKVDNALLQFSKDRVEPAEVVKDTTDFRKVLDGFMPLKINRFEVNKGTLGFIDSTTTPIVNVKLSNTYILAQNLSSVQDTAILPASVIANADVYRGKFDFKLKLDPLADKATFDMNTSVKNTYLPDLNNFLKAYGNIDVNQGSFGLYSEVASKNGVFKGYVKPVIKDLDVVGSEDRHDTFLNRLWEHIVGGVGVVLKNPKKDQVATEVALEGNFNDLNLGTWDAVAYLLRNAFIQALYPALDNKINLSSLGSADDDRTFLQKVFTDPEKQTKREERKQKRQERREERRKQRKENKQ